MNAPLTRLDTVTVLDPNHEIITANGLVMGLEGVAKERQTGLCYCFTAESSWECVVAHHAMSNTEIHSWKKAKM